MTQAECNVRWRRKHQEAARALAKKCFSRYYSLHGQTAEYRAKKRKYNQNYLIRQNMIKNAMRDLPGFDYMAY